MKGAGAEFVALVALTTSLVAMSIDAMLPALGAIASDLRAADPNDRQLILTTFFGGLTIGQLVYRPLSDSIGRKPAAYIGLGFFIAGGLICAWTHDFTVLLWGRALHGFGAAGPRVVAMAMIRDQHAGRAMARVMSFVNSIFILVPILAPSVGQGILLVATWREIFLFLVGAGVLNLLWLALRQPETLAEQSRAAFSAGRILRAAGETFKSRITLSYGLASGLVFGAFLTYLTTSQQIFQEQYGLGELFPVIFGALALSLGAASIVNARLVMRFGMRALSKWALRVQCSLSFAFCGIAWLFDGHPPLPAFVAYLAICFFCNGLLFGNYNARAMEPMGHIAGVAAAILGALSSLLALIVGTPIARAYDGTVLPLTAAFAFLGLGAFALTEMAERAIIEG